MLVMNERNIDIHDDDIIFVEVLTKTKWSRDRRGNSVRELKIVKRSQHIEKHNILHL